MADRLPVEDLVAGDPPHPDHGSILGRSREDRPLFGWLLGRGRSRISLIAGCHADEPVGPETLRRLVDLLNGLPADDPLLAGYTWFVVPDVNPDGAERNATWTGRTVPIADHQGVHDRGFDLQAYAVGVERELPRDDVEFGFPRSPEDEDARPENRCVGSFLAAGAPFALHGTLHGMSFAPGPWFLIEPSWIDRTPEMRNRLRQQVHAMGYALLDVDREGDKGFSRIDEGFSTRPDSRAMAAHFLARDDPGTAALFRPSSMEYVRGLGGDPLTFVSEMPLFLQPATGGDPRTAFEAGTEARLKLHAWLAAAARRSDPAGFRREAAARGIAAMPIRDQMRLQVALINACLETVEWAERLCADDRRDER